MRSMALNSYLSAFSSRVISRVVDLSMTCREIRELLALDITRLRFSKSRSIWVQSYQLKAGKFLVDFCASSADSVDG